MSGFRLERMNIAWAALGALSFALARRVGVRSDSHTTVLYFVVTLCLYYLGNSVILGTGLRGWLLARLGERRATHVYDTALGLMFVNQGLGLGSMSELNFVMMPITPTAAIVLGGAMMAIGIVIKVSATLVLGVDGYYYRDMLLGRRSTDGFARRGPYRWLQNPMYGLGQLHAYGYAVLHRSWSGLAAAAICQTLIYTFYLVVERPFVERVYARNFSAIT